MQSQNNMLGINVTELNDSGRLDKLIDWMSHVKDAFTLQPEQGGLPGSEERSKTEQPTTS